MTYLLGALQVPMSSVPTTTATTSVTVRSSLSDSKGTEPLSKRVHPWSFPLASSRYTRGANSHYMLFLLPVFWTLDFEEIIVLMIGAAPSWAMKWSLHVLRLPLWSGCSIRHCPRSTTTFFIQGQCLVGLRKRAGIVPASSMTSYLLTCFFRALFP
jgi:hypothetical protein